MFGKTKNYIIHSDNLAGQDIDLIGQEAIELAQLTSVEGIVTPESLVLTSTAFDDFIAAAGLIDKVSDLLSQVDLNHPERTSKISEEISDLILQANFPSIILKPLVQAYKTMSGFTDKYVVLKPSWVIDQEFVPSLTDNVRINVKGEASLLYNVKKIWASMFSENALNLRIEKKYSGGLSMAIIVQRMIQAEISGKVFSHNPVTLENNGIQIEATLGLRISEYEDKIHADIYTIDPQDWRVIEKNIVSQEFMVLRKGRATPEEDPNMLVKISPEWQRKQKLDDLQLSHLINLVKKLINRWQKPVEIHWAYEAGRVYILSAHELVNNQELTEFDLHSSLADILNQERNLEIIQNTSDTSTHEININKLAEEVENIASGTQPAPLPPEIISELADEPSMPLSIDEVIVNQSEENTEILSSIDQLITEIYLDISDMSSETLANASSYRGAYFDGTSMLLRHGVLPESIIDDPQQFKNIVESYALEISTASKIVEPKPLIYSFSDIGELERSTLLGDTGTEVYTDGSERFVFKPEAMIAEILAIKRAVTKYSVRNLRIVMPKLRSRTEMYSVKKILSSQSIKRSAMMQLFAEVATGNFMYEIVNVEPHELDGIIINLDKLTGALSSKRIPTISDYDGVFAGLEVMLNLTQQKKFKTYIICPPNIDVIKRVMDNLNPLGIVFSGALDSTMMEKIQEFDQGKVSQISKRGRKPKALR